MASDSIGPRPVLEASRPGEYLGEDEFIQTADPAIRELARDLRHETDDDAAFAKAAFEWVRDRVGHSYDVLDPRVTLSAADVLEHRVGLCYAKSHLLAALLRSEGIPTGLCYQRLSHGEGHVLHGLVAIHLDGAWHRHDPRGNKDGIDAQFSLEAERLAWPVDAKLGEIDYPRIFASPARCVTDTLRGATDILALYDTGLPTGLDDA
ncbi:transglutaminase-like putative cysteine protease [Mycobacterium frederiksbergense]|uniref:Transglutaminase-like putative cysteine protease n=1 Tax=Mycolicibacterium frederiksbergense TaxID=117567 RepID=A0ABT6L7F6_9MYCO|nr:transglutaminase family protein [Mycolicibacterium frederiksbergense]MDH6198876.1 transglutaminase-like putative cysteine protease [Mycolicibacterium frederiksbergense]